MSECVVRMEMPKDCWRCPCGHSDWILGDDGKEKMVWFCGIDHDSENERHYQLETEFGSRPSYCPILAVLPEKHGRLIDADKIDYYEVERFGEPHYMVWKPHIDGLPTIVPAERKDNGETC